MPDLVPPTGDASPPVRAGREPRRRDPAARWRPNPPVTLVAKLAAARRRKRKATGKKVEGRKSHAEARSDVVRLAKALARKKPKGGKLSLRAISAELAAQGFLNERGKPFNPKSIAVMLAG